MARILGLDLGAYSVKGVLLETAMRNVQVRTAEEIRHQGDVFTAASELFAKPEFQADQVVVAFPGLSIATHSVWLPFSDTKRIESTLAFELEEQLPFDLAEAAYDYQIATLKGAGCQLLVGVVKRQALEELLEKLKALKRDPRIVTHPALAFQNVFSLFPAESGAVAVVDVGHERTSVAIGRPSIGVESARTFAGGGLNLTKALAQEFQVDLAEAQRWKDQHAAIGEHAVGADAQRGAAACIRGFQGVLRELKSTLKFYAAKTKQPIEGVYLCGGTSRMNGLAEQLSTDLGLPVKGLQLPLAAENVTPSMSLAYALALRGSASGTKAPRFNLRRGEYAYKSDFDFVSEKMVQLGVFAATLFILLIASSIVRNTVLERREQAVDAMFCEITTRYLGRCEKDPNRAVAMLKGSESPVASIPKYSAVTMFSNLTRTLPPDVPVTIENIVIDLDRITARMETDSSKHVEDIISALKSEKCFHEVTEGKLEKNKDGTKVGFRLDIQVQCPEPEAS